MADLDKRIKEAERVLEASEAENRQYEDLQHDAVSEGEWIVLGDNKPKDDIASLIESHYESQGRNGNPASRLIKSIAELSGREVSNNNKPSPYHGSEIYAYQSQMN